MIIKKIDRIVQAEKVNMGGHLLDQPLPLNGLSYYDPFLLIHHWRSELPGQQHPRDIGVGPHPHRGFSPVTFVFEGDVEHRDSLGNRSVVRAGGTQWMFAGKGITHSERQSKDFAEKGGPLEFIQFWVNAPSKDKMKPAEYIPLSKEDTPSLDIPGTDLQLVSGKIGQTKGPVNYFSPLLLLKGEVAKGSLVKIPVDESLNTLLYILSGSIQIQDKIVGEKEMVLFENKGEIIEFNATSDCRIMLLGGKPQNEKVSSYGPFVMTSQTEIMEALRDAQSGKMGVLIEEFE